ncbi:hypothetical protein D9M68_954640 [compost metagenome]
MDGSGGSDSISFSVPCFRFSMTTGTGNAATAWPSRRIFMIITRELHVSRLCRSVPAALSQFLATS